MLRSNGMTRLFKPETLRAEYADALPLLYQRYRFIALATCGAVLLAGLTDGLIGGVGPNSLLAAPETLRFVLFVVAVASLISVEGLRVGAASFTPEVPAKPSHVLLRLVPYLIVFAFGDPIYSQILFLILCLYAYLAVGKTAGYLVGAAGLAVTLSIAVAPNTLQSFGPPPSPGLGPPPDQGLGPPTAFGEPFSFLTSLGRLVDRGFSVLVILFFTFLLARALARDAEDQVKLETLHASLETSHRELRASTERIAEFAATEERNRLARDIHDSLGHHLAAINIQLQKASAYKERDPERAGDAVKQAQRTVQDALKDVRESVGSLRKSAPFSFEDALDGLLARMQHGSLKVNLHQTGDSRRYSNLVLMTLYRVIQEGMTNVHKHADASEVCLALDFGPDQVRLNLSDNGSGFDVTDWQAKQASGFGLVGLQERLGLVGGKLTLRSWAQATTLTATIPKRQTQPRR